MSDPAGAEWIGPVYIGRRANFIRRHRQIVSVVVVAVSVATCLGMCCAAGWSTVGNRFAHLAWWFVPVMIVAHLTAYASYLVAHHQVVNRSRSIAVGWFRNSQVVVIGFGGWLARGGFTLDRRALEISGASRFQATISTVTLGLLEMLVLAPAAWVCALILLDHPGIPASVTWPWVIGVPVGAALVLSTMRVIPGPEGAPTGRVRAAVALVGTATRTGLALVVRPHRGPLVIAGIAVYWAADIVSLWAALRFFSISLGLPQLIVAYGTGYILTRRTLPFAGVIAIELLLAIALWSVGPTLAAAALAVLVYRLSDFALTLGPALIVGSAVERTLQFVAAEAVDPGAPFRLSGEFARIDELLEKADGCVDVSGVADEG